jgi:hypothetical protein
MASPDNPMAQYYPSLIARRAEVAQHLIDRVFKEKGKRHQA